MPFAFQSPAQESMLTKFSSTKMPTKTLREMAGCILILLWVQSFAAFKSSTGTVKLSSHPLFSEHQLESQNFRPTCINCKMNLC